MFKLYIQLLIEELLSGGNAYIASHPELGVPLGIFNDINEPDYNARIKSIQKLGPKGSNRSLSYAKYYGISDPIPSFEDPQEKLIRLLDESNQKTDELRGSTQGLNRDLMDTKSSWAEIKNLIGGSGNVMRGFANMISGMGKSMALFTVNTREQYEVSEKIAEQYKTLSYNIGLTSRQGAILSETFKKAIPYIARYGGEASDLQEIYTALVEESGRLQFLSKEDMEHIFLISSSLKMSNQDAAGLADRFQLMGINIETMYNSLEGLVKESRSMGLNSQKVIEVLERNFAAMQRMSFKGGIKGMTEMAKLAVNMRMDVSEMLGMADKFYSPEAAIEAAAELQLMGGDIAKAFGDPFEIMYLARNKPEELARRVGEMTENMILFNEESGQFELPPEARQQLTFMADKLGLSKDNIIDTAFQARKLSQIKSLLPTEGFDEDQMTAISNLATMGDGGKWEVKFGDDKISLDDTAGLQDAIERGLLLGGAKDEGENLEKIRDNSFTTNQLLLNLLEEFKSGLSIKTDFYKMGEGLIEPTIKSMKEGMTDIIKNVTKEMDAARGGTSSNPLWMMFNKKTQDAFGVSLELGVSKGFSVTNLLLEGKWNEVVTELITVTKFWNDTINKWGSSERLVSGKGLPLPSDYKPVDEEPRPLPGGPAKDFLSLPGGNRVMFDEAGSFNIAKNDLIVGGTNLLDQGVGGEILKFGNNLNLDISGTINLVSPNGEATNLDMNKIKNSIQPIIIDALNQASRNGGTLTGKETVDRGISV